MKKVLWVKFGWSDFYRGGPVDGNFGWLNEQRESKQEGRGHEAFNFDPGPDGTYYCYVPPQRKVHAPMNSDPHGWTVVCLAKHPKHTGIHVVGWYEDATLLGEWLMPPKELARARRGADNLAYDWSYCITAKKAFFVPPERRTMPFSDISIKQGKYSFLEGPDVTSTENKRRVLKLLKERLGVLSSFAITNPNPTSIPDPEADKIDPLSGFGTPEHRKKVEKAAEQVVIAHYEAKGFVTERVSHLPCGYDFLFTKGNTERHVEVKGTSGPVPRFYLTRNEREIGMRSNPAWRLAMVTDALSPSYSLVEYDARGIANAFDVEPYVYIANLIPKSEN